MVRVLLCLNLLLLKVSIALPAPVAPPSVSATAPARSPTKLILDTDIGNDIDDALALAMIHALENRGEVELLAVTISKDNPYAAPFVNLVNTFYGRPAIPIGVVKSGKTPEDAPTIRVPASQRDSHGRYLFPHTLLSGAAAPEAVSVLTRILREQPDNSVTIAQIGFSTNLARLLQTPGGRELIQRKVKLLSVMGGNFATKEPEYNIYTDPPAAAFLLREWPTFIVFSGFEIGSAITFPYTAFSNRFLYSEAHPIVAAARNFFPKPEDRPAWDPTAVLYAIRPDEAYFSISEPGEVSLGEKNTTVFHADPQGRRRYLLLQSEKVSTIRQLLVDLVTEPPAVSSRSKTSR